MNMLADFEGMAEWQLQLFANVDNTLNKVPPVFAAIAINSGGDPYDLIGRTYRVGFRLKY